MRPKLTKQHLSLLANGEDADVPLTNVADGDTLTLRPSNRFEGALVSDCGGAETLRVLQQDWADRKWIVLGPKWSRLVGLNAHGHTRKTGRPKDMQALLPLLGTGMLQPMDKTVPKCANVKYKTLDASFNPPKVVATDGEWLPGLPQAPAPPPPGRPRRGRVDSVALNVSIVSNFSKCLYGVEGTKALCEKEAL